MEVLSIEKEKIPFSLGEIINLKEAAEAELREAGVMELFSLPDDEKESARVKNNQLMKKYEENLLRDPSRFKKIFITEGESVYFVLETGEILRLKKQSRDGELWRFQPIKRSLRFVDSQEARRITDELSMQIGGQEIRVAEYKLGSHPIELEEGDPSDKEVVTEERSGTISIKGTKYPGEAKLEPYVLARHCGHKIVKIIK